VNDRAPRQMGDRRQAPRRQAEVLLHYAEVNLHAAAIHWAATQRGLVEAAGVAGPDRARCLRAAEENVQRAEDYLQHTVAEYEAAYRQETTPTPAGG
jgi:hypothetical protein